MKITSEGIDSKLDNTEEWISYLEDRVVEIPNQNSKMKKNIKKWV